METVVFWVLWGLISFWALKTFYYSFSKEKVEQLRKTALGFSGAVLVLSFLPWVPPSMGGLSGIQLALEGNFLAIVFSILLVNSLVLFLQKEAVFLKIGALLTILSTLTLFTLMLVLRPETFTLSSYDVAPIVAVIILLCQNVAVLLLWQQLDLQKKDILLPNSRKKLIVGAVSLVIFTLGVLIFIRGNENQISESPAEQVAVMQEDLGTNRFESFPLQEPGLVCFGDNRFSFQIDSPYRIMSDDKNGIALFVNDSLVTVSVNGSSLVETLQSFGIPYTNDGDVYSYAMPSGTSFGISKEKNGSVVSVFSSTADDTDALELLSDIVGSLQEGCTENE